MSLGSARAAAGIHFVSFSSPGHSIVFSAVRIGSDSWFPLPTGHSANSAGTPIALAKSEAAVVDTVEISRTNFRAAAIPISSYQVNLGIIVLADSTTCVAAVTPGNDGHAAGTNCMTSGCHAPGDAGPGTPNPSRPAVFACGTLYDSISGGTPVAGATVTLIDSHGQIATLATSPTGVFWIGTGCAGTVTTCPADSTPTWISARVSRCPDRATMTAMPSGNCGSCHGASAQIHLP
jgi:hypothetical protein